MTLVDRPLVQYAIDEGPRRRNRGIHLCHGSRGKGALEDYFDVAPQLEQEQLRQEGQGPSCWISCKSTNMDSGEIAYIRQAQGPGPRSRDLVRAPSGCIGNQPFAVMLPDDVIAAEKPCLQQMVEAYAETGGNMVAAMEVPQRQGQRLRRARLWPRTWGHIVKVQGHGRESPRPTRLRRTLP